MVGRYDPPVMPSSEQRFRRPPKHCTECGDRGYVRAGGITAACSCAVERIARLERELAELRALRTEHDTGEG